MWKIITLLKISVANKEMRSVNCKLILKISSVWRAKLLYKGATISGNWLGMSSLGKRQCRNEHVGGKRQRENPDTIVAQTYCLTRTSQGWWSVIMQLQIPNFDFGNLISDISFLPPSNVGVKGNLHEMHQHNPWPIAADGQIVVIVKCEYKNNRDIEMTSFCLTGTDAGQSGPMSTHWGSGEVRGRSPHLLPATLD